MDTAPATAAAPPPAPEAGAADPSTCICNQLSAVPEPARLRLHRAVDFRSRFRRNAALILGAGVLLGLLLGALLMRQWQRRRMLAADDNPALPPALYQHHPPIEPAFKTEVMPEIRFAARLDAGETTIEFAPLVDSEAVAIEQSSDQHA